VSEREDHPGGTAPRDHERPSLFADDPHDYDGPAPQGGVDVVEDPHHPDPPHHPRHPGHPDHPGHDEPHAGPLPGDAAHDHDEVDRPKRRRRGLASCLVVLAVLAALVGGAAFAVLAGMDRLGGLFEGAEDYEGGGTGSVVFEVEEGDSSAAIGRRLKAEGVVASVEAFTDAAAADGRSRSIQVGFYELRERMSAQAALEILVDPQNLVQSTVTIPEGLRVEEVLQRLADQTDVPLRQLERAAAQPRRIGLPDYADGNPEGYLFPATYAFPPNADATRMLSTMVDRWRQAAEQADLEGRAEELGYTPHELMTIASLVESEVNQDDDRGKVARVIYNRLETDVTGRLLQIDATVNYALGRKLGLALTQEDLQVDSPYNTRRFPGLPPGPIESPGDASIEAAANPPDGDWVYYATVNLDTGETKFTDDYDEFLRYKRELQEWCQGSDRC
jgi:UPF0755 protein